MKIISFQSSEGGRNQSTMVYATHWFTMKLKSYLLLGANAIFRANFTRWFKMKSEIKLGFTICYRLKGKVNELLHKHIQQTMCVHPRSAAADAVHLGLVMSCINT